VRIIANRQANKPLNKDNIMKKNLRCMIVDDDPEIVALLKSYVDMCTGLVVVYADTKPKKALERLQRMDIDILIIDMEMQVLKGLDFLAQIRERIFGNVPGMSELHVIICSAHRDYALDSYLYDVCDFILKPFNFPRFMESIDRVKRKRTVRPSRNALVGEDDFCFIKKEDGRTWQRVDYQEIIYIEADGNDCKLWIDDELFHSVHSTMKAALLLMPRERFVQVHRSFSVAYEYIHSYKDNKLKLNHVNRLIPMGDKKLYRQFWEWWAVTQLQ